MPQKFDKQVLLALAQHGAPKRLQELRAEMAQIERLIASGQDGKASVTKPARGRRKMSAAARKAHSLRMKAFWAAKRKGAKPAGKASSK